MDSVGIKELQQNPAIARLVAERGATMPKADLVALAKASELPPAAGPPSGVILDELREERL